MAAGLLGAWVGGALGVALGVVDTDVWLVATVVGVVVLFTIEEVR